MPLDLSKDLEDLVEGRSKVLEDPRPSWVELWVRGERLLNEGRSRVLKGLIRVSAVRPAELQYNWQIK